MVEGGPTITESLEAVRYIDEKLSQGGPLGGDAVDREFVRQWGNQVGGWVLLPWRVHVYWVARVKGGRGGGVARGEAGNVVARLILRRARCSRCT